MNPFKTAYSNLLEKWRSRNTVSNATEPSSYKTFSINSDTFLGLFGATRRKPTSEVTYFTCLKMLSETLAKMPVKYYQKTEEASLNRRTRMSHACSRRDRIRS